MPEEFKYDISTGAPTLYAMDDDDEIRIRVGTMVRIKLVGLGFAADDISVIGTIKEDYLGPFI
eukprot:UN03827